MKTPRKVAIENRPLVCRHCGHDEFYYREILLSTSGMAFLGLDWLNKAAQSYICAKCGHIMRFAQLAPKVPKAQCTEEPEETMECLSCNAVVPGGETVCPKCGWTYGDHV